jgi:uncharacterized protein with HEPN domain
MSQSTVEFIKHIRDEAQYVLRATAGVTKEQFLADETLTRAILRSLEVMGEAAKQVPPDFRSQYPDIPWRAICGMRDRVIHGYLTVDYDIVWYAVTGEVPLLLTSLLRLLDAHSE